tara:strand:+ start:3684 stop:4109 length:426 start_codon:yes stop_codon:yes gene_type:complete
MIDFIKSIKDIKSLLFIFTFIASILFFSTVVNANEQKKEEALWKLGDFLHTMIICREEKDILEIGYADTQSMLDMNRLIQLKMMQQSCMAFNPPLRLEIAVIVGEYKDYSGKYTTMVGVSPIGEPENIVGYLIVLGRPLTI